MKKEIELTEEELAIGMWVYIYLYLKNTTRTDLSVDDLKLSYLKRHGYICEWKYHCLLCHRYMFAGDCSDCPLLKKEGKYCGVDGSSFDRVVLYGADREKAIQGAEKILEVMIEEARI